MAVAHLTISAIVVVLGARCLSGQAALLSTKPLIFSFFATIRPSTSAIRGASCLR